MLPTSVQWVVAIITIVSRSALSTIVALLLWSVLPNLVGFQTTTVMSGSMEPRLQVGDAIIVRHIDAAHLLKGQVLLFDDPDVPGRLRLHRLVEVRSDGQLVTKGDANGNRDSSTVGFDAVHGAAFLRIPYAGLPNYWLRTGQVLPLAGGGAIVLLLLSGIRLGRLLEDEQERERRRHRGVRLPGMHRAVTAGAVLVVLSGVLVAPAAPARAAYSGTTANGTNVWNTMCGDVTPTGLPASPQFYWGYGTVTSGVVTDLSGQGDPGALLGDASAAAGCVAGASPAVSVGSATGGVVTEQTSHSLPGSVTVATWFKTAVGGGVLADFGSAKTLATSGSADRVLYMRSNGSVSFGGATVQVGGVIMGSPLLCTSPSGYANNQWHFVVATWSNTTGCTISVDNGTPVVATPSLTVSVLGYTGYWRFGLDAVSATNGWTGQVANQFVGSLDESQVYSTVLSPSDRSAIYSRGHGGPLPS